MLQWEQRLRQWQRQQQHPPPPQPQQQPTRQDVGGWTIRGLARAHGEGGWGWQQRHPTPTPPASWAQAGFSTWETPVSPSPTTAASGRELHSKMARSSPSTWFSVLHTGRSHDRVKIPGRRERWWLEWGGGAGDRRKESGGLQWCSCTRKGQQANAWATGHVPAKHRVAVADQARGHQRQRGDGQEGDYPAQRHAGAPH
jgi:hypothetical protein